MKNKITPFLWFNGNIQEALDLYCSVFKNASVTNIRRMGGENGKIFTATFELEGQCFMALDGGPLYAFTEATSFFVSCETQAEVDELWEKLSEGGSTSKCGWLKDRFGLSWQIIPTALGELMGDPDPEKSNRVMQAMLQMEKIDIAGLQAAYKAD